MKQKERGGGGGGGVSGESRLFCLRFWPQTFFSFCTPSTCLRHFVN